MMVSMPSTYQRDYFKIDFWKKSSEDPPDFVMILCLMPNGIVFHLKISCIATIREIKHQMIQQSKHYPLSHLIKDENYYDVSGISAYANVEVFTDESKRLCDVQPYFCLLSLAVRVQSVASSDYELLKLVSNTIGKSVENYSAQSSPEIDDFRRTVAELHDKIEYTRSKFTWIDKLLYEHPLRLAKTPVMPQMIRDKLNNSIFLIVVILENDESSFTLSVNEYDTPRSLIDSALQKISRSLIKMGERVSDYILKVRGRDEYLLGDFPLIQFIYIQECLSGSEVPNVVLKPIATLSAYNSYKQEQLLSQDNRLWKNKKSQPKVYQQIHPESNLNHSNSIYSWDIEESFSLKLHQIDNVNCDLARSVKVGVHIGLYHGERLLCAPQYTTVQNANNRSFKFEERIKFDIQMQNLPRMTRLCLVIFEITKSSRSKKSSNTNKDSLGKESNAYLNTNPLAWVNTTIFDYKNKLPKETLKLYAWTYADDMQTDEIFHPLGTIEPNPRNDECAVVQLTFHNYGFDCIEYPSEDFLLERATAANEKAKRINTDETEFLESLEEQSARFSRLDKRYEVSDRDRIDIWARRFRLMRSKPEKLSTLLNCINWNEREEVAGTCSLLKQWPIISVEKALELLDYAYPDPAVRSFAIRCLRERLRDEEMLLYLLQLVQAIKHESYLKCDLVLFILERALLNQRIGHYFFWHLRSEMQTPAVQRRFSLLLEAYLKGCKPHLPMLRKQLEALEKLKAGSLLAKKGNKDKARSLLQEYLQDSRNGVSFQGIQSPLNPSFRWKAVKPEKCKIMDSKMRPLWAVFENADSNCNDIYVIFKNGDDLRQDMLTLQMLRVMDQLWKNEGYDFRMNIYNCISMEDRLGMIEVVLNAETIANIQKEKGMFSATSPFKKGSLYSWLKDYNKKEEDMNRAVKEFTLSCAGYCVATYVLGVADRHSDNIMVKRNGQLFHIDYGHFLGHFKEKFGVRRERVPFVLTHDFVFVINKGVADREAKEFQYFREMCENAFLVLHKHRYLILSLFAMMISTGLPELSSEKDLDYLKETLVLEMSEEKACEHFRSKFSEALSNSWKTSLNWASHNFSKNNKQ